MSDVFNHNGTRGNRTHSRGDRYYQVYEHIPILEAFYFDFEKDFDPNPILDFVRSLKYTVPILSIIIYLVFCYYGVEFMKKKKPYSLVKILAAWNLFLSIFSTYGAIRTVPHMIYRLVTEPFERTICEPAHTAFGSGACGFAVLLFVISKIPELIDTVFIVLRKKPLIFLHWYHHITVLFYGWNAYVTEAGSGLYSASMNFPVHAIMYFYYFLQAIKCIPNWFPTWIITILQISQMIIGTFVVSMAIYYHNFGGKIYAPGECNNTMSNLIIGGIIYSSYLYLFIDFAMKRFFVGLRDDKKIVTAKKNI